MRNALAHRTLMLSATLLVLLALPSAAFAESLEDISDDTQSPNPEECENPEDCGCDCPKPEISSDTASTQTTSTSGSTSGSGDGAGLTQVGGAGPMSVGPMSVGPMSVGPMSVGPMSVGGCGPCGSGSGGGGAMDTGAGPSLSINRHFRPRDQAFVSGLGAGMFLDSDAHISLSVVNQYSKKAKAIDYFDPAERANIRLTPDAANVALFKDTRFTKSANITLYSSYDPVAGTGTLVTAGYDFNAVSHAVLNKHTGEKLVFQMFTPSTEPDPGEELIQLPKITATTGGVVLPSGQITGFGFYSSTQPAGTARFDNVTFSNASSAVLYREVFPLGGGQNSSNGSDEADATREGWTCRGGATIISQISKIWANGAAEPVGGAVNSFPVNTATGGCLVGGFNNQSPSIFFATEYSGMTTSQVATITWDQGHTQSIITPSRVAVAVNGIWYVSNSTFSQGTANTWEPKSLAMSGATWHRLDCDLSTDNAVRAGRLVRVVNRNGYASVVNYVTQPGGSTGQGDALWKVANVQDAYGRTATYTYSPTQVGGRWVVSSIALPTGGTSSFTYDSARLTGGTTADGGTLSVAHTYNATTDRVDVTFSDPDATGHRRKHEISLTPQYSFYDGSARWNKNTTSAPHISASAGQRTRRQENGAGEMTYFIMSTVNAGGATRNIFLGGGAMKKYSSGDKSEQFATTWSVTDANASLTQSDITAAYETHYAAYVGSTGNDNSDGTPPQKRDHSGVITSYEYNAANSITKKTFADGSTETWTYGAFELPLQYKDRMGRVTTWTYDTRGNKLTEKRGRALDVNGNAVDTPDTATWTWLYFPSTNAAHKFLLQRMTDPNGKATDYAYDSNRRLSTVTQPPDVSGGTRAVTTYAYKTSGIGIGMIDTITDPTGRVATYTYDAKGRTLSITRSHPTTPSATSTESYSYYNATVPPTTATSNDGTAANAINTITDRNGNRTKHYYDLAGRLTRRLVLPPGTALTPIAKEETWTHLRGTELVATHTVDGTTTSYGYDYRLRRISETRRANTRTTAPVGALTTTMAYNARNEMERVTDPYGRSRWSVYDHAVNGSNVEIGTGRMIRSVQDLLPGATATAVGTGSLANLARVGGANPSYVIDDVVYFADGSQAKGIDGRGIVSTSTYDQQGRTKDTYQAAATVPLTATMAQIQAGSSETAITQVKNQGRSTRLYDGASNITEIRHPRYFDSTDPRAAANRTTMTYTGRNLLASRTVGAGGTGTEVGTETFTYYLDGRQKDRTDARSQLWTKVWGVCCGLLQDDIEPTAVELGSKRASSFRMHDKAGNITHTAVVSDHAAQPANPRILTANALVNPVNQFTTRYDVRNRPIAQTVWLVARGNVDPDNVPIAGLNSVPLADGLTTWTAYDDNLANGFAITYADGTTSVGYTVSLTGLNLGTDAGGSAVAMKNPDGESMVVIRDGQGRTVRTYDGLGNATTTTYDTVVNNLLEVAVADPNANVNKARSDGGGRTREQIDALAKIFTFGFDAVGNQLTMRQPVVSGQTAVGHDCAYDDLNRKTTCVTTHQTGSTFDSEAWTYDAAGNLLTYVDPLSKTTTQTYDARQRKLTTSDRVTAVTAFAYDAAGNLLSIKDGDAAQRGEAQETTAYTYNERGLLKEEKYRDQPPTDGYSDADIRTYTYDGARRLKTRLDQAGVTTTYDYDMANRLKARQYNTPASDDDTFDYDRASRLTLANSARYNVGVGRAYDNAGRLTSETQTISGQPYTVGYTYDAGSRVANTTYPSGKVMNRTYTARNQLDQIRYDGALEADRTYDDAGRLTGTAFGTSGTYVENRTYRVGDNRLATLGMTGVSGFGYTYDAAGRKLSETNSVVANSTQNFSYDDEARLTGWNRNSTTETQSWTLSKVGDWNATTYKKDGATATTTDTRAHDPVHQLTQQVLTGAATGTRALTYDTKGNLTNDGNGQAYTWDEENRLRTAVVGATTTSYLYDALGRRTAKISGATTRRFVHNGAQVIAEYVNAAAVTAPELVSVWGDYIDELMLHTRTVGTTTTKYWALSNHLYSVAALISTAGAVQERYRYDAYGKRTITAADGTTIRATSSYGQQTGFTGRYHDQETGLQFFRARYYSSGQGRFISRDGSPDLAPEAKYNENKYNLYAAHFAPQKMDPTGRVSQNECSAWTHEAYVSPGVEKIVNLRLDLEDAGCMWKTYCLCSGNQFLKGMSDAKGVTTSAGSMVGSYDKSQRIIAEIFLFHDNILSQAEFNEVLMHELVHVKDVCTGGATNDCRQSIIREIRGAFFSGECDEGGSRRTSTNAPTKKACVNTSVWASTVAQGHCSPKQFHRHFNAEYDNATANL